MIRRTLVACVVMAAALPVAAGAVPRPTITIGSKAFPESWILGEALAILARGSGGVDVEHRSNLGGTEIVYQALRGGSIDVYPEYTGTIAEVILKSAGKSAGRPSLSEMRRVLADQGIGISDPLGFNDGYALAVTAATQRRFGLRTISDLARHPELEFGLTHEFLGREDGLPGLARTYALRTARVRGIQHELAYGAIATGKIDVMDIYTTDAQIDRMGLVLLADDRGFFPRYDAVLLYRLGLARRAPRALRAMLRLVGSIDEARMTRANARVVLEKQSVPEAAPALLEESLGAGSGGTVTRSSVAGEIARHTAQHLKLVALSLLAAIAIGIPLGILASRTPFLAALTLSTAGLLQTLPSLALLAILIPIFGIGAVPALIALFLYSLLPIVRNTYIGLVTIPTPLVEAARVLGLSPRVQLFRVTLPLASPALMAGIKTSAVINVGTATLAALIGAGGLGDPILSGIQLRRNGLILEGAVPAAVLALLVQWGFDLLDRWVIPRGLRLGGPR